MSPKTPPLERWPFLLPVVVHLAVVLAALTWAIAYRNENIAAGLGLLAAAALGLPWSVPMFFDPDYYGLTYIGVILILTTCGLLNVTLHALIQVRRWQRSATARTTSAQT